MVPVTVRNLPNFFIVGAPKAGTTSLYHYLDQHPQVYMSPIKEPNYFASELRPENFSQELRQQVGRDRQALKEYFRGPMRIKRFGGLVSEWEDYVALFESVREERAIGEASVCYLWSETAAANIRAKVPEAKIIMILRNPLERAFSQYLHAVTNGAVRWTFREQIEANLRCKTKEFGTSYPFLEFGLYHEQVKRYLGLFPRNHVRIYWYDEYKQDPGGLLRDVLSFLGVDNVFAPSTSERHLEPRVPRFVVVHNLLKKYGIWQRIKQLSPTALRPLFQAVAFKKRTSLVMDPEDRAFLVGYYREDVWKLSTLLDHDLRGWLDGPNQVEQGEPRA